MSSYKARSDYYKKIAHYNKLIAHDRAVAEGSDKMRKSFHRINDEDELNAACANWAHFPCVVHVGYEIIYRQNGTGIPRRVVRTHLYFLSKTNKTVYSFLADAIEVAYDEASLAMSQFIGFMDNEAKEDDLCSNTLFLFDVNRSHAEQIGPINDSLYGWHLQFEDEAKATELIYHNEEWFENDIGE
jgi:hypothetical protein